MYEAEVDEYEDRGISLPVDSRLNKYYCNTPPQFNSGEAKVLNWRMEKAELG